MPLSEFLCGDVREGKPVYLKGGIALSIGENIRKYRKICGLKQKELGKLCNISESQVGQYEIGIRNPSIETLVKIANAMNLNPSDLDERLAPMDQDRAEGREKLHANLEQKKDTLHKKNMESILDTLTYDELLCQMAEETAELCQAAMKYRRKMGNVNHTKISWKKAEENLLEEIADVMLLAELLLWNDSSAWGRIEEIKKFKANRWVGRLKGEEAHEQK